MSCAPSASPDGSPATSMSVSGRSSRAIGRIDAGDKQPERIGTRNQSMPHQNDERPPAFTAMPASPAAAARSTVGIPMVGRSTRSSCCGFGSLTSTPRRCLLRSANGGGQGRATLEHLVGAFGRLDRKHEPFAHHGALPDIQAAERTHDLDRFRDVAQVTRARGALGQHPRPNDQLGQHIIGRRQP